MQTLQEMSLLHVCSFTAVLCKFKFLPKYFQSAVGSIHRYGDHANGETILQRSTNTYARPTKFTPFLYISPKERHISEYQKTGTRVFKTTLFQSAKHILFAYLKCYSSLFAVCTVSIVYALCVGQADLLRLVMLLLLLSSQC